MFFSGFFCVVAVLTAFANGFTGHTRLAFSRRTINGSGLKMVADDAKVCLVTGSSRGLGKAIALELGKAGQKVVVNYVSDGSKESADNLVSEIKQLGGDAVAIKADSKYTKLIFTRTFVDFINMFTKPSTFSRFFSRFNREAFRWCC